MMSKPNYVFFVTSAVASRDHRPMVTVTVNGADFTVNMSPDEARDLAQNLLQAAASAENDAFFIGYLKNLGVDDQAIMVALIEFRKWKNEAEGMPD